MVVIGFVDGTKLSLQGQASISRLDNAFGICSCYCSKCILSCWQHDCCNAFAERISRFKFWKSTPGGTFLDYNQILCPHILTDVLTNPNFGVE